eukprot:scaffold566_cov115-Isochrysis_galbana.AAC.4
MRRLPAAVCVRDGRQPPPIGPAPVEVGAVLSAPSREASQQAVRSAHQVETGAASQWARECAGYDGHRRHHGGCGWHRDRVELIKVDKAVAPADTGRGFARVGAGAGGGAGRREVGVGRGGGHAGSRGGQRKAERGRVSGVQRSWWVGVPSDVAEGGSAHGRLGAEGPPVAEILGNNCRTDPTADRPDSSAGQRRCPMQTQPITHCGRSAVHRRPQLAFWTVGELANPTDQSLDPHTARSFPRRRACSPVPRQEALHRSRLPSSIPPGGEAEPHRHPAPLVQRRGHAPQSRLVTARDAAQNTATVAAAATAAAPAFAAAAAAAAPADAYTANAGATAARRSGWGYAPGLVAASRRGDPGRSCGQRTVDVVQGEPGRQPGARPSQCIELRCRSLVREESAAVLKPVGQ